MKFRGFVGVLLILVCGTVFSEVAYFDGRSGDVVYTPSKISDDSFLFLVDKSISSGSGALPETSVADLISHLLGTPVVNPDSSRSAFPSSNIFQKDKANFLVVLESVGSDLLAQVPQLNLLKQSGQQFKLEKVYYPEDATASLATMFTGYGPSVHGVVSQSWTTPFGSVVAYSDKESSSQVASLADVVSQSFGGRSLIISASANRQFASALGVNQYANPYARNAFGFYFDQKTNSIFSSKTIQLPETKKAIIEALAKRTFTLRNQGDSITISGASVVVDLAADNMHATFDLSNDADFLFFTEVNMLLSIVDSLTQVKSLVEDDIPDLLSFTFSSIKGLSESQKKVALLVLDGVLGQAITKYRQMYNGEAAVEIAFMGTPAYEQAHEATKQSAFMSSVYEVLKNNIKDKQSFENSFPVIYVSNLSPQAACTLLENNGLSQSGDFSLTCPVRTVSFIQRDQTGVQFGDSNETDRSVAIFQIVLWFSIVLIFAALAAVLPLCLMDSGAQPTLMAAPKAK